MNAISRLPPEWRPQSPPADTLEQSGKWVVTTAGLQDRSRRHVILAAGLAALDDAGLYAVAMDLAGNPRVELTTFLRAFEAALAHHLQIEDKAALGVTARAAWKLRKSLDRRRKQHAEAWRASSR